MYLDWNSMLLFLIIGLWIWGFWIAGLAGMGLAGEVGGYGLGLGCEGGEKVTEKFFVFGELGDLVAEGVDDGIALGDGIVFGIEDGADGEEAFRGAQQFFEFVLRGDDNRVAFLRADIYAMLIYKCGTSACYMHMRGKMVGFIHFAFAANKPLGRYIGERLKHMINHVKRQHSIEIYLTAHLCLHVSSGSTGYHRKRFSASLYATFKSLTRHV